MCVHSLRSCLFNKESPGCLLWGFYIKLLLLAPIISGVFLRWMEVATLVTRTTTRLPNGVSTPRVVEQRGEVSLLFAAAPGKDASSECHP